MTKIHYLTQIVATHNSKWNNNIINSLGSPQRKLGVWDGNCIQTDQRMGMRSGRIQGRSNRHDSPLSSFLSMSFSLSHPYVVFLYFHFHVSKALQIKLVSSKTDLSKDNRVCSTKHWEGQAVSGILGDTCVQSHGNSTWNFQKTCEQRITPWGYTKTLLEILDRVRHCLGILGVISVVCSWTSTTQFSHLWKAFIILKCVNTYAACFELCVGNIKIKNAWFLPLMSSMSWLN